MISHILFYFHGPKFSPGIMTESKHIIEENIYQTVKLHHTKKTSIFLENRSIEKDAQSALTEQG